ncbi:hypothetical protein M8C21_020714 [Ambrosia artemisiifolia]|uniref:O-fucosyltransferase family protein n=1 Tax=Ambrosia artemisiifolia TaxID=4212 RepID=A0AAD5GHI5_AMBAR|nr:hypothetical protein M8C21_020714 [Ambrosia artemisiifolia]
MGELKGWRYSGGTLVVANNNNNNQRKKVKYNQQYYYRHCCCSWSVVCGLGLFVLGLISLFTGHVASNLEWYSQKLAKHRLWYYKVGGFGHGPIDIWKSEFSKLYYGCSERGPHYAPPVHESLSNGYLLIAASGGLNQQRTGITDAVVVARILNATLVVPELDHHSFWKDDSDFANIFDVDWFISFLAKDIPVVKRVPDKYMRSLEKPPYTMRVPRKSEPQYYLNEVLPTLLRRHVVQLTKFDFRLANDLNEELQRLRCRANYHAFRFTKPLQDLGHKLVMKMRSMAKRYIAVHLSALSMEESLDGEQRRRGKCPLTPHEVGLMLRALGFDNDTYIFGAFGEIYGGEETLQPLKELFPNFYTKETLANQELQPFLPYSSRLAAIDYIVCEESDVFVTNNNGNMAKIIAGQRRYMGHKRTIRPNARKLSALFMQREKMPWTTFCSKVKSAQRGFMGEPDEIKSRRADFHEYPASCICKKPFKVSDLDNQTDSEYGRMEEDQGVNSTTQTHEIVINEVVMSDASSSSREEKEDDVFLAD